MQPAIQKGKRLEVLQVYLHWRLIRPSPGESPIDSYAPSRIENWRYLREEHWFRDAYIITIGVVCKYLFALVSPASITRATRDTRLMKLDCDRKSSVAALPERWNRSIASLDRCILSRYRHSRFGSPSAALRAFGDLPVSERWRNAVRANLRHH